MNKIRFLKNKILLRFKLKNQSVFLRQDFHDLAGYDQVGRSLKELVRENKIIKVGYGLYTRAEVSPLSGKIIPQKPLPELALQALNRLGVSVTPSRIEKDYNAGRSTQVPTGRLIGVKGRVTRKIGYGGVSVSYERSRA